MTWILSLPEWLEKNIPRIKRIRNNYPRALQAVILVVFLAAAIYLSRLLLHGVVLDLPKLVVHRYIRSLNERNWAAANACLVPQLASAWKPEWMPEKYHGFVRHFDLEIRMASTTRSAIIAW